MDEWLGMDSVGYPVANVIDLDPDLGHRDLQSYTVENIKYFTPFIIITCRILKEN